MNRRHDDIPVPAPVQVHADRRLDTVGLYCPVPIIRTSETVSRMSPGEVLEVLSDDRVILIDMPAWCRSMGHGYLGARQEGGELHLYVRKQERPVSTPAVAGKD
ncbi:MAG TPA: sulfurtransferase TusA family protein [Patescibacteria group bacterium]|jgi:TusA-related sulfurtransferase|nr:sulfurtransferase TusA family protein [Patescibacteria group bacterium]